MKQKESGDTDFYLQQRQVAQVNKSKQCLSEEQDWVSLRSHQKLSLSNDRSIGPYLLLMKFHNNFQVLHYFYPKRSF